MAKKHEDKLPEYEVPDFELNDCDFELSDDYDIELLDEYDPFTLEEIAKSKSIEELFHLKRG